VGNDFDDAGRGAAMASFYSDAGSSPGRMQTVCRIFADVAMGVVSGIGVQAPSLASGRRKVLFCVFHEET
jgi:hypothetical protein